jgi:Ca2+-binding RTX toxin-like protein
LVGNTHANSLRGSGGNDVLVGAGGQGTLTGGTGADRFVHGSAAQSPVGAGADRIIDFSHAQGDWIDLAAIDANATVAGNQASSCIGNGLYTGVAGQLRTAVFGGITVIGGDLNGDKITDFHIALTGAIALVATDFVL